MTNEEIDEALAELGVFGAMERTGGDGARWDFAIAEVPAFIQTQADVDRMRIVGIIGNPETRENASLEELMAANFRTALDVRYALFDGRLTAAFLHPLSSLTREQLIDGLRQVSLAVRTVGSENASSPLTYGVARSGNRPFEQFEDPKMERRTPPAPDPYRKPRIGRDYVVPIVAAIAAGIAGAIAGAIAASLL